jgi:putative oxidoreductase
MTKTEYGLNAWGALPIRIALGVIFIAHGGQKVFGLWGGPGLPATMRQFHQFLGIPAWLALVVAFVEFFGGIALIVGVFTRLAALGLTVDMVVAVFMVHLRNGFFMNWTPAQHPNLGHGIEYNVVLIGGGLALLITGGGKLSIDWLFRRGREPATAAPPEKAAVPGLTGGSTS